MSEIINISKWKDAVKSLIECMSVEQLDNNFSTLLGSAFYTSFRIEKEKNKDYRFGQHTWNCLEHGGIVSCPELFYEVDEEVVKDFIACFLYEAGSKLTKG